MKNNHINYVEFPCTDIEKTKTFFTQVFGWTFTDFGENYTAFSEINGLDGGFFKAEQSSKTESGSGLVVFYHTKLESLEPQIVEAGGKIVKTIFEFPGGRRFHFEDPSGNEWAVWSNFDENSQEITLG